MALSAGVRLGPYEIVSAIGAGGMGEVYKATDTRLDRTVAIKVLVAHVADDPDLRQRLDSSGKPRPSSAASSLSPDHLGPELDGGRGAVTESRTGGRPAKMEILAQALINHQLCVHLAHTKWF